MGSSIVRDLKPCRTKHANLLLEQHSTPSHYRLKDTAALYVFRTKILAGSRISLSRSGWRIAFNKRTNIGGKPGQMSVRAIIRQLQLYVYG